jgi:flavin reductase
MEAANSRMRAVMGRFVTGVSVVTTEGLQTHGMTANALTSLSLDPPLVLVCVAKTALMHQAITDNGVFAVSILGAHQSAVAAHFADRSRPRGRAQFEGLEWFPGQTTSAPLLTDAVAWIECCVIDALAGGDHTIFVGKVLHCEEGCGDALVFNRGRFQALSTPASLATESLA